MDKTPLHESVAHQVYELLQRGLPSGWFVQRDTPLQWRGSVLKPDISVVLGTSEDTRTQPVTTAELVVEIAVGNLAQLREHVSLYAEAGVKECWIILGVQRQVEVYWQPQDGNYQMDRLYRRGEVIESTGATAKAVPIDALFV